MFFFFFFFFLQTVDGIYLKYFLKYNVMKKLCCKKLLWNFYKDNVYNKTNCYF